MDKFVALRMLFGKIVKLSMDDKAPAVVKGGFYFLISIFGWLAIGSLSDMKNDIGKIADSVVALNKKVTVQVERSNWQEKEIDRHGKKIEEHSLRLRGLEMKTRPESPR